MLNDLLDLVPATGRYIFFGADDIPKDFMIDVLINHTSHDIVQFGYMNSDTKLRQQSSSSRVYKKSIIDKYGKYENWRCGGDTEMMYRLKGKCRIHTIELPLFIRRVHKDSLTNARETGTKSAYRVHIWKLIKKKYGKT